jgi:nucleotide-binding universal stress UspA family protein
LGAPVLFLLFNWLIMKTIIIPTDFSVNATNAVNYAADMAKDIGASLLLLHVYQVPVSVTEVPVVLISEEELRRSAESGLNKLKNDVEHITSGAIKIYTESRLGDTVDELEELSNQIKPFAIIMGTKGGSGLEHALFGSTTLKAIRHISWPVIAVPPGTEYGKGIKKIGFACDFKEVVKATPTPLIKEVIKQFNAELHVLNVDYHNRHFKPETPEQSLLLHTMFEDLNPVYDFIEHEDIEDGINQFAEKNNLDLIITIPKKHKLLDGLFRKSSTKQLLAGAHIPVMCVHE